MTLLPLLAIAISQSPSDVEWDWAGGPQCPERPEVRRRFDDLAPEACRSGGEPLRIGSVATRTETGEWHLRLVMQRGAKIYERDLSAQSCQALAEAAVVIAAAACPSVTEPAKPIEDPSESTPSTRPFIDTGGAMIPVPAPDTVSGQPAETVRAQRPAASAAPRVTLGPRIAGAAGPGPAPSVQIGGVFRLLWPRIEGYLAVDASPRRRVAAPAPSIDVRVVTASLGACPTLPLGPKERASVGFCIGVEAGAMVGSGVGTPRTRTRAQPWLGVGSEARVRWWIRDRVTVGASCAFVPSVLRPAFVLDGFDVDYRASRFALRAGVFGELVLW